MCRTPRVAPVLPDQVCLRNKPSPAAAHSPASRARRSCRRADLLLPRCLLNQFQPRNPAEQGRSKFEFRHDLQKVLFALFCGPDSSHIRPMAKNPENPKKPGKSTKSKAPGSKTPVSKASRPDVQPIGPALAELLNPAINRGESGIGSSTGLQPPPDNSRDRRSGGEAAAHRARASTPKSFGDVDAGPRSTPLRSNPQPAGARASTQDSSEGIASPPANLESEAHSGGQGGD